MSEWQQINAQIDAIIKAIPEHYLLDPPDGGDVSVAEGVQRMADNITALRAENERLRAALERLHGLTSGMVKGYIEGVLKEMKDER